MDDMSHPPHTPILDPSTESFLARLIRRKAHQLVGRAGFRTADKEDIEQELQLKVVKHLAAYNGERGHLHPFLTTIIERQAATLVRNQAAAKRDPRRVVSLNVEVQVDGEGYSELSTTIGQRESDARLCRRSRHQISGSDLKQDVDVVIAKLSPVEQRLCDCLKRGSITETARELGIPRSTVYDTIARLRKPFEAADLQEYLQIPPTFGRDSG